MALLPTYHPLAPLQAMTPKATGGPNDAAPKEETAVLSREEGEVGPRGRKQPASFLVQSG